MSFHFHFLKNLQSTKQNNSYKLSLFQFLIIKLFILSLLVRNISKAKICKTK